MKNIIFLLCVCTFSLKCGTSKHPTTNIIEARPNSDFAKSWNNLIEFEEAQGYLKNLDFSILSDTLQPKAFTELLETFQDVTTGGKIEEVIPNIQEILERRNNPNLVYIYTGLIEELLRENNMFQAAYDNFPQENPEEDFNYALKDLPRMQFLTSTKNEPSKLRKIKYGQLEIECLVNSKKAMAIFDTGADLTTISKSFAKKHRVTIDTNHRIKINTVTSRKPYAQVGYIEELQIGSTLIKNNHVLIFNDEDLTFRSEDRDIKIKLDFILGWNAIRELKIELNTIKNQYSAAISKPENNSFQDMFWCGYPGVKVNTTDGQSLIFGLDTGSSETELKINAKNKINFPEPLEQDTVEVHGVGGGENYLVYVAHNLPLVVGEHQFTFNELPLLSQTNMFLIHEDGTLGADIFNNNIVTIDFPNKIFKIKMNADNY